MGSQVDETHAQDARSEVGLATITLRQIRVSRADVQDKQSSADANPMNRLVPYLDLYGRLSDDELARLAGVPAQVVGNLRRQVVQVDRALARFTDLLPRLTDAELVRLTGATPKTIRFWRLCQPRFSMAGTEEQGWSVAQAADTLGRVQSSAELSRRGSGLHPAVSEEPPLESGVPLDPRHPSGETPHASSSMSAYRMPTAEREGGSSAYRMPTAEREGGSSAYRMPTAEREGGSSAYRMPTAERESGSAPYRMPTAEREIGSAPYRMPTAEREGGSSAYRMPTAEREGGSSAYRMPTAERESGSAPYRMPTAERESGSSAYRMPTAERESGSAPYRMPTAEREGGPAMHRIPTAEPSPARRVFQPPPPPSGASSRTPGLPPPVPVDLSRPRTGRTEENPAMTAGRVAPPPPTPEASPPPEMVQKQQAVAQQMRFSGAPFPGYDSEASGGLGEDDGIFIGLELPDPRTLPQPGRRD